MAAQTAIQEPPVVLKIVPTTHVIVYCAISSNIALIGRPSE